MSYTLNPEQLSRTRNYLSIGDRLFGFGQSGVWAAIRQWGRTLQELGGQIESLAPPQGGQTPLPSTSSQQTSQAAGPSAKPGTPSAPPVTTGGQAPGPTGIPTVSGSTPSSANSARKMETLVPMTGNKIPVNKTPSFIPPKL